MVYCDKYQQNIEDRCWLKKIFECQFQCHFTVWEYQIKENVIAEHNFELFCTVFVNFDDVFLMYDCTWPIR